MILWYCVKGIDCSTFKKLQNVTESNVVLNLNIYEVRYEFISQQAVLLLWELGLNIDTYYRHWYRYDDISKVLKFWGFQWKKKM